MPAINALQKNFLDSRDVAHALHTHGVNIRLGTLRVYAEEFHEPCTCMGPAPCPAVCRNLAQLLKHDPASPFKDAIIREVIARSAKHLFRLQVEKLAGGGMIDTSHMEEIHR